MKTLLELGTCFFRDYFTYYFKLKYFLAYKLSKSMEQPLNLRFRYPKISLFFSNDKGVTEMNQIVLSAPKTHCVYCLILIFFYLLTHMDII